MCQSNNNDPIWIAERMMREVHCDYYIIHFGYLQCTVEFNAKLRNLVNYDKFVLILGRIRFSYAKYSLQLGISQTRRNEYHSTGRIQIGMLT